MGEQSQIDAMRAAVRGDLDRARARRAADPWRSEEPSPPPLEAVAEPELEVVPDSVAEAEPVEEPEPEVVPESVAEAEPIGAAVEPEPEPETHAEPEAEAEPPAESSRRGFFASLFRRD